MTILPQLNIIGIAIRTTNQNNQAANDLGALWERFLTHNIIAQIPNKVSTDIYTIYTDYQSNYTEAYTAIIGIPVASLDIVPPGMVGKQFPAQKCKEYIAQGEIPQAVVNTWQFIWAQDAQLNRSYTYDCEVYTAQSQMGNNSQVSIYIGIKDV